ncbi:MAG: DUF2293 domain-containing protein [Anaerolineae bacterium]|nr:DUF2293 domain-containing protein [Anaerolineae bacterium]
MTQDNAIKVFISHRDSTCGECGENLGNKAWITLLKDKGALCLSCADLDHLVFLPAGDAALTRRARKLATLSAVVLEWSRSRKRYERQGLLVEEEALQAAEAECIQDSEARERRRLRQAEKRIALDQKYVKRFAQRVRKLFPMCPEGTEQTIAEHACLKYSGRVGRTAAAKALDEEAVRLAVIAHIRHKATRYDDLLAQGFERGEARAAVAGEVRVILSQWEFSQANE